ncbi:hypothetical protein GGI04_002849 [Coemansia thaxteri]|uniref:BZIP domain-containing protein n=1 Tax=Coemansia thaxteri TaxID=2663907 RepID=A0A9W8EIH2_9FUNG|nr:hypothetical protein GGI04_002849 [Coemansia thaxteri]KAJ2004604.1 hypothetical protein H4R26_002419 [Coemansia thaxteri]KAJ2468667.1 hypothetical protein GGI02_003633 [Coemansia sp. RSA 2322]
MSDYSVWNQLFRLNPESPHTPMLSTQELQDDLALWGSVQFQLEPVGDEALHQHSDKAGRSSAASAQASAAAWGRFMGLPPQGQHQEMSMVQPGSQQIPARLPVSASSNALDFMMGATTTADILSAIAATPLTPQQWAHFAQQQQPSATPAFTSDAAPQTQPLQTQPLQTLAIAPGQPQFRYPTIVPKAAPPSSAAAPPATPRKAPAKTKVATPAPAAASPLDDMDEEEGRELDGDDSNSAESGDGRLQAADEDKRRRNTAASARFRVKKKLKEQALERTAREMSAKADALEQRVHELETETRWLKSLLTDKDPSLLTNIRCPCHHPHGLDLNAAPLSTATHQPALSHRQPPHLHIAPAPAAFASASAPGGEPPLKRPRV